MGNISIWQILIILLVVALLFGMGRLPRLGEQLGKAIRGFRRSMDDEPSDKDKRKDGSKDKK